MQEENETMDASVPLLSHVQPPAVLKRDGDMGRNWCEWKRDFVAFLDAGDPEEKYKDRWGTFLLKFIGGVGQEAYTQMVFKNAGDEKDYQLLLQKLDLHFLFGNKVKDAEEKIDDYINNLMRIAITSGHCDVMSIVKEKVIQDILAVQFSEKAKNFISSISDNVESYLKGQTLNDITFIWKQCEKFSSTEDKTDSNNQQESNRNQCVKCGTQHAKNRCPARGKQCEKCKKLNHFTEQCKSIYIDNCPKCGTRHVQSRCIAFGEICSKCGKSNHFSWKCRIQYVENCSRCGTNHILSACPAQGKLCLKCNKPNHFEHKCFSKVSAS